MVRLMNALLIIAGIALGVAALPPRELPQYEDRQWAPQVGFVDQMQPYESGNDRLSYKPTSVAHDELVNERSDFKGVPSTAKELFLYFKDLLPYLIKLMRPIMKNFEILFGKGKEYVVEYLHEIPPEILQKIQMKGFDLISKIFDTSLLKILTKSFSDSSS